MQHSLLSHRRRATAMASDAKTPDGVVDAMSAAASRGDAGAVLRLLDAGMPVNRPDKVRARRQPVHGWGMWGRLGSCWRACVRCCYGTDLCAAGAIMVAQKDVTALMAASEIGHFELVTLLLDRGANMEFAT